MLKKSMSYFLALSVMLSLGMVHANALKADESVFGELEYYRGDLTGYIFWLDKNTKKIPSFKDKKPVGEIFTKELNIPKTKFDKGFPGISDRFEWFAIVFHGQLFSPKEQTVKFRVASDDGSKLYINRKLVVDNDGLHAIRSKEGTIKLKKGWNEMHLEYFQGPRHFIALQVYYTPPGGEEKNFSMADFATPPQYGDPNRPPSLGGPEKPPKKEPARTGKGSNNANANKKKKTKPSSARSNTKRGNSKSSTKKNDAKKKSNSRTRTRSSGNNSSAKPSTKKNNAKKKNTSSGETKKSTTKNNSNTRTRSRSRSR